MHWLTTVLARLEASVLADWVGGPIYPLISALHIFAIAFLIAPVILADLRVLRFGGMDDTAEDLSRIALYEFCGAVATGVLLFSVQATRYFENPALVAKFAVLVLAGTNAAVFKLIRGARRVAAALSIGLWCAVLLAGRWIAFAD